MTLKTWQDLTGNVKIRKRLLLDTTTRVGGLEEGIEAIRL
jgi:hypothetical protein